jgi:CRISPR-associated endonuclease Csn1
MRLIKDDCVRLEIDDVLVTGRVCWIKTNTQIAFAPTNEANTDARARDNDQPFSYITKTAGVLQKLKARRVTISPIGELHDPGFRE